jgi:hypothetical protein
MPGRQALWSFRWRRAHSLPSSRNPSQAAPARASRPRALPARCFRSTRRSPARRPRLPGSFVDGDSEGRTADASASSICACTGANRRSNVIAWRTQRGDVPLLRSVVQYADCGLWMIPLQNAGLLDIREITACRPGGSATQAAPRRHGPSAASPASPSPQSCRL